MKFAGKLGNTKGVSYIGMQSDVSINIGYEAPPIGIDNN